MRVLHHGFPDLAQRAAACHESRLAHQRVPGVGEGQPIEKPGAADDSRQRLRLFEGGRGRLVAHHVEPMLQGGSRDGQVEMIRGNDADKIDGIFPFALPLHHLFKICVGAVRADAVGHAGLPRSCRILTESSRDQFDGSIQLGRHAMYRPDKRARATTHHPHTEPSALLIHLYLSLFPRTYVLGLSAVPSTGLSGFSVRARVSSLPPGSMLKHFVRLG